MANGIAWESQRPTLCLVITSVGVYGLIQALYAACVNRRPVVVVSGEVSGVGCGSVQAGEGWDGPSVTQATRPFTAWSVDALRADLAIRAVRRAGVSRGGVAPAGAREYPSESAEGAVKMSNRDATLAAAQES